MPITRPQQDVQKLSVDEANNIREQNSELEAILRNPERLATALQDPGAIRGKLARNKALLARDEKLRARGKEKDKIMAEIRQIKEVIARERPTRKQMALKPGSIEFNEAVRANVEFHKKHGRLMLRLKDLQRRLEPDDPHAGYVDYR